MTTVEYNPRIVDHEKQPLKVSDAWTTHAADHRGSIAFLILEAYISHFIQDDTCLQHLSISINILPSPPNCLFSPPCSLNTPVHLPQRFLATHMAQDGTLYHYRDKSGREVDAIVQLADARGEHLR